MNPTQATNFIIDCGTMTGHQQTELEIPKKAVTFFNLTHNGDAERYLHIRLANGILVSFRAIYRPNNGMWRIELSDAIPEIKGGVFPTINGQISRRSNYAVLFTKINAASGANYELRMFEVISNEYTRHFTQASTIGDKHRTTRSTHGRDFGWY